MAESTEQKTRWSYSRATCFGRCKYEFYLDYIINDDDLYLSEGNYYAEIGSFTHEILAKIFSGELKVDDAPQYFMDHYESQVCYKVMQSTMDKTYETIADYFASLDISWIDKYEIVGTELEVKFKLDDYDFIGYIDLLLKDRNNGKFVVLDHKSSEYPFKKDGTLKKKTEHGFELYKKQMYLYCHAVNQLFGDFPKQIMWNHFKDGGKLAKIPFQKEEYIEAMNWFRRTLEAAGKETEYEPTPDFFYCNNLCNFRNSCEYREKK